MEDKIDYGRIDVPTSWDGMTLKKYQDIQRYYSDKDKKFDVRDVIHIMIDKDIDFVNSLPAEFLDIILDKLSFITDEPEVEKTNKIVVDGETYSINIMEKLKLGEYVAVDNALKNDRHDYATFMAILCRKDGEVYDSKFEAEMFEKRKEMFENVPVMKVFGVIAFFLDLYIMYTTPSQLYSKAEDALNHIQQTIDNSGRIGAFRRLYMNWRMRRLRKSLRSCKPTLLTRSHTSHTLSKRGTWKRWKTNTKKLSGRRRVNINKKTELSSQTVPLKRKNY